MTVESRVATVIVTYNRRELLEKCLLTISMQTRLPDCLFVIDNACTDGTTEWLRDWLPQHIGYAELVVLPQNVGGAGGFAEGMKRAIESHANWIWMMDDDAEPEAEALEMLIKAIDSNSAIYGSIAITTDRRNLCWPLVATDGISFDSAETVPYKAEVVALPFLGVFIPRTVVEEIGYPDADYFIAGDDTEYCFRARAKGFSIYAVSASRLQHPPSRYYRFGFGSLAPLCFYITPWKRYYDVRNRMLTAWRRGTLHVWTRTVPAIFIRLLATLINEPDRINQLRAYTAGFVDGIRKLKGVRHRKWGFHN